MRRYVVIEVARMSDKQRGYEEKNVNKRKKHRRRPSGTGWAPDAAQELRIHLPIQSESRDARPASRIEMPHHCFQHIHAATMQHSRDAVPDKVHTD
jgi:hypothetical protein